MKTEVTWFLVQKELPKFNAQRVYGYDSGTGWRGDVYYFGPGDWRVENNSVNNGWQGVNVTHWMRLPSP